MKRFFLISLLLVFFSPACKKSHSASPYPADYWLYGRWKYVEYGFSIGGPEEWQPAVPANRWIEFGTDGIFVSTSPDFDHFLHYTILDSERLVLKPLFPATDAAFYIYRLDPLTGDLVLSPYNPSCIEGCGSRFTRLSPKL
jgi:hypothetical protein